MGKLFAAEKDSGKQIGFYESLEKHDIRSTLHIDCIWL